MRPKRPSARARRILAGALFIAAAAAFTGCRTVSYYAQAVRGQCQMLARQQSCEKLLADPNTPDELKVKLQLSGEICDFARRELKLPANGHYQHYADLHRRHAVWNVYAAPEFSLEPKTWWYPIVGSLEYRGFFAEQDARKCAAELGGRGFDVYIEGVEAYSTLGWFTDPLLNTFIHHDEAELAEILFHELAHQRVFTSGDTDFNEAFATAVGEEGVRRWCQTKGDSAMLERYSSTLRRNAEFVQLVTAARNQLKSCYGDEKYLALSPVQTSLLSPRAQGEGAGWGRGRNARAGQIKATKTTRNIPPAELRREKQRILDELRRDYEKLKADWGGYAGYDEWFARGVNNAQLNSVATYYDLRPAFERLLQANGGDLEKFYSAAKKLTKLPKAERQQRLVKEGKS